MKRLSREVLRRRIWLGLSVARGPHVRPLGLNLESYRERLTDDLVQRIMGSPESEAVVLLPDMVGDNHTPRRGEWGVDEPHPHPDLPKVEH